MSAIVHQVGLCSDLDLLRLHGLVGVRCRFLRLSPNTKIVVNPRNCKVSYWNELRPAFRTYAQSGSTVDGDSVAMQPVAEESDYHVRNSCGGLPRNSRAVLRVGALKIGSTTLSYLVAAELDRPLLKTRRVVKLMSLEPGAGRELLQETVADWLSRPNPPDRLLIGGGQVLRERPELAAGLPVPVWILSGGEEGWLTRLGIAAYRNINNALVVDIGGGSTELVAPTASFSLPVGVHRPTASDIEWPSVNPVQSAVVVGGMGHILGLLLGLRPFVSASSGEISDLAQMVATWTLAKFVARGVPSNRAELVTPGLRLLTLTMQRYQLSTCSWAPSGLLEGLWLTASLGRGACWGPHP